MILIAAMMIVFCLLAAISIDYAYVQLVRTEMRSATDAAAKAGAEALARMEDIDEARAAAVRYAALNTVGGKPLKIRSSDVLIGRVDQDANGRWQFSKGKTPTNAVQVLARTGQGAATAAIPLFLPGVHKQRTISPKETATAGQQVVEVVLCLDRSGSMCFDMSGLDYSYPSNNPLLMSNSAWNAVKNYFPSSQQTFYRNYISPPHPSNSRWAVLDGAIDLFLTEAGKNIQPPRTALVTWASDNTMPCPPYTKFQVVTTDVVLPNADASFSANRALIDAAITKLGKNPMLGATNLSAGLDRAVSVLTGPGSSKLAGKVVILFTDGQWNEGRSPIQAAQDAKAAGITVHCVVMLTADQPDIRQVAAITGGKYYLTSNQAELSSAFRELARSLPVVLTE